MFNAARFAASQPPDIAARWVLQLALFLSIGPRQLFNREAVEQASTARARKVLFTAPA